MIKKIISILVITLLFTVNVFANDISGEISINNNTVKISLKNIPENIHALELVLTDKNANTNINFSPNSIYSYNYKKESVENGATKISIIIDNINSVAYSDVIYIGTLTFSSKPDIDSKSEIELVDLQQNLTGTHTNINLSISNNNENSSSSSNNNSGSSSSSSNNNTTTETTTQTTTKKETTTKTTTKKETTTQTTTTQTTNNSNNSNVNIDKMYPVVKESNFSDTKEHWANEPIKFLADRGIISGMNEESFEPNKNITRAEFITLLAKMDNININKYKTESFKDVASNAWYNPFVDWAVKTGISSGISEEKFSPESPISREQMAVMIQRFCDYKGFNLYQTKQKIDFKDENNISNYAKDSISRVQQAGIINGRPDGSFAPKNNATRAEAAQMLYVMLKIQ